MIELSLVLNDELYA